MSEETVFCQICLEQVIGKSRGGGQHRNSCRYVTVELIKLCSIVRSTGAHRTESVSVMALHRVTPETAKLVRPYPGFPHFLDLESPGKLVWSWKVLEIKV